MRFFGIDSIKAIAALAVVYLHIEHGNALHWELLTQLARFAVPAFFIFAGYFFTRSHLKGEPLKTLLPRYLWRIGLALIVWLFFFDFVAPYIGGAAPRYKIGGMLYQRIAHPATPWQPGPSFHPWFLIALIEGLIMLSFFLLLRRPRLAACISGAFFVVGLLISAYSKTPLGIPIRINPLMSPFFSTFFVWIGAALAQSQIRPKVAWAWLLLAGGFALQLGEGWLLQTRLGIPLSEPNFLIGTVPFALGAVFMGFSLPEFGAASGLNRIGKYSLGIYIFHPFILALLNHRALFGSLPDFPLLITTAAFALTAATACVCSYNKHLARLFS